MMRSCWELKTNPNFTWVISPDLEMKLQTLSLSGIYIKLRFMSLQNILAFRMKSLTKKLLRIYGPDIRPRKNLDFPMKKQILFCIYIAIKKYQLKKLKQQISQTHKE